MFSRTPRTFLLLAAGTLAVTSIPRTAAADPSAEDEARAREHFQQGRELASEGRCEEAIEHFETGYALSKRPLFLFNAAECAREAGEHGLARAHYSRYLEEDPHGDMAGTARRRLEELPEAERSAGATAASVSGDRNRPGLEQTQPAPVPTPTEAAATNVGPATGGATGSLVDEGPEKPIWKRWPLWVGVGAAVVAAVVVPVAVTQSGGGDGVSCGSNCAEVDFR